MTSNSRAMSSQSQKIVKLKKIMAQTSLDFESTCYLTDVQCMIGKTRPDLFDTIHDILRSLSLVQSLPKGRNALIWRQREPTHMRLPGTDGLSHVQSKVTYGMHKTSLN